MKLLARVWNPVTVDYFGLLMPVPPNVKFLATDNNGDLYGYTDAPVISLTYGGNWDGFPPILLANIDLQGKYWSKSLVTL